MNLDRRALMLSTGALCLTGTLPALSQDKFPSRPLKIIVPFAPGGANDIMARVLAPRLAAQMGQPVVIDNKGGAGGAIGAQFAARAEPDGYTMLFHSSTLVMRPFMVKDAGYDWRKDLSPVSLLARSPFVLVVHPSVPVKTFTEFLAYAKTKDDQLFFGSAGPGSSQHLAGELFNSMAGTKMKHVPYKGNGPATAALLAGDIQVMFDIVTNAKSLGDAGKVRPLAVSGKTRIPNLPNLPPIHESGVANFDISLWQGASLPKATSAAVVQQWQVALTKALTDREVQAQLGDQGFILQSSTPAQLSEFMQKESVMWGKVIADANIRAED
jgi:tripartite-type tricarboxylate transporter receptor subunit TctC